MDLRCGDSIIDSYEEYEKEAEKIRNQNAVYLSGFKEELLAQDLSTKVIKKHLQNVDFYINEFLLYYDAKDVSYGCYDIGEFLGEWFIRKAMWSNETSIKENITSFKKFYSYLLKQGVIDKEDYDEMCEAITSDKEEWLDLVRRYNDIDEENPFSLF